MRYGKGRGMLADQGARGIGTDSRDPISDDSTTDSMTGAFLLVRIGDSGTSYGEVPHDRPKFPPGVL
jgi:hypothetical protein